MSDTESTACAEVSLSGNARLVMLYVSLTEKGKACNAENTRL